jgi:hypothetical protein
VYVPKKTIGKTHVFREYYLILDKDFVSHE